MSLDVYLEGDPVEVSCRCIECDHRHTRTYSPEYYSGKITGNLIRMADHVGLYEFLWEPGKVGVMRAGQLVEPLRVGLHRLRAERDECEKLNPPNGWGNYEIFVQFVVEYLEACEQNPDARVKVWR